MLVKFKVSAAGERFSIKAGELVEMSSSDGRIWCDGRRAEEASPGEYADMKAGVISPRVWPGTRRRGRPRKTAVA